MRKKYKKYLTICSLGLLCYLITVFGTFVFDDSEAIVKNKDVMPSSPFLQVFQNDFWGTNISLNMSHKSYRPLTILSYRLNVFLSNSILDAFHMHLTNIILYIGLCLLTLPIFKMFTDTKKRGKHTVDVPFLSSVLFTVHPIHTEVVAGLVGRADILSSILFLLSLLLYRRLLRNPSKLGAAFTFCTVVTVIFAAVLCKETAITAVALCVVYDFMYSCVYERNSILDVFKGSKGFIFRSGCLGVTVFLVLYFRLYVMNFEGPTFTKIDNPAAYSDCLFSRVFTYNYIYFLNILLLLWPQWLCFDWSMGCIPLVETLCDIRIVFVFLFWFFSLAIGYAIITNFRNNNLSKSTILGISMLVIPFIPASNLFLKVGFVIAERTLLLPSAGFCLLVADGYRKINDALKPTKKTYLVSFYALCVLFSIRTIRRNVEWLEEETLFTSALNVCPTNAKVHYNVGKVAADQNNRELAVYEYEKAIELNPNYEQAMNNLANILRDEKRFEEAEVLLRRALEVRPNFAAAWMNLGIVLSNLNQPGEAEGCYLRAISFRRKYPDCYYNLGNLYLDLKRNEEALFAWEKAVLFRPTHISAWSNMLVLLDSLGNFIKVLELGKVALMHNPKSAALHFSIGNTLGKMQEFEKAELHFLEALNFNPHNALYYSNLGVLYHRWGKSEMARQMYRKALHLDPAMKTTENNLRKLLNAQHVTK